MLELACGTGSILAQLRDEYEVVGVDLSPQMLAIAWEKLPGVELIEGDMTEVRLGRTFDAVLCLYDSINHLLASKTGFGCSTPRARISGRAAPLSST